MNIPAISLVVISAFIHVLWNVTSKRRGASAAFFLLSSLVAGFLLLPCLYVFRAALPFMPASFWWMVGATGLAQTVYFIGLTEAYRNGDMAVAYPLLRAVPVLLVALVSVLLRDGLEPRGWGMVGIGLVAAGCLMLPLVSFRGFRFSNYLNLSCMFALVAALGTTCYSLIDDRALRLMGTQTGISMGKGEIALLYLCLQTLSTNVFLGIFVAVNTTERTRLLNSWRKDFLPAVQICILLNSAYGLVLTAMTLASSVSYIVAFRQLSIPLGAVIGMTVQNEPRHIPRVLGIVVVSFGLVLLAVGAS